MSQCAQNTTEFINNTFGPKIAVVSSPASEKICLQNGLSVVELLKPFSQLNSEYQIRDPTNLPHVIRGLSLAFSDPLKPLESPQVSRKVLSDEISNNYTPGNIGTSVYGYHIKQSCPWYESFRDLYFQHFHSLEHDSIMHYLACVITVSSGEDDPLGKFAQLKEEVQQNSSIKWVVPDRLCYYVLIHDLNKTPATPVEETMQALSVTYGPATCHVLRLHSKEKEGAEDGDPPGPNPWRQFARDKTYTDLDVDSNALTLLQMAISDEGEGSADVGPLGDTEGEMYPNVRDIAGKLCGDKLTIADQAAIRNCINEFVVRGLLPSCERRMKELNEALNARRGLRGTLFTATKKLFSGGPKAATSYNGGKLPTGTGYLPECPELQMRRLGDIAFLLQHYSLAFTSFHSVKRDFQNDQAYNHYAAALEMTALSVFMLNNTRRDPHTYYEECINVYHGLCKAPQYAMRATIIACECLVARNHFDTAAIWFIKMTNDEADLISGLLLEQGAHCFVRKDQPSLRKYAFHLVLAGHRFSKAGQRKHALRCYKSAWEIFQGKGWCLAEDHIGFTIGRHSYNIRDVEGAYKAYKQLLTFDKSSGNQTQHSQILFQKGLQDFVSVVQIFLQQQPPRTTVELPVPVIAHNKIDVRLLGENWTPQPVEVFDSAKRRAAVELEEAAHSSYTEHKMVHFRPAQSVFSEETLNVNHPTCCTLETVVVKMLLYNPLQIPITLSHLSLHCLYCKRESGDPIRTLKAPSKGSSPDLTYRAKLKDATKEQVETSVLETLTIGPEEEVIITLTVRPLLEGNVTISGLNYRLVSGRTPESSKVGDVPSKGFDSAQDNHVAGRTPLNPRGPRLNNTKEQRLSEIYGVDNRLNLSVTSSLPRLELDTSSLPTHLFCGEVKCGVIKATNNGRTALSKLCLATSHHQLISVGEVRLEPFQPLVHPIGGSNTVPVDPCYNSQVAMSIELPNGVLEPGQTAYIAVWVYGGDEAASINLHTILYYTPALTVPSVTHRVVTSQTSIILRQSVTVSSSVHSMSPTKDSLELIGSVTVNNVGYFSLSLQDLHVTQLSLISDQWLLKDLETCLPLGVYPGASLSIPFKAQLVQDKKSVISSIGLGGAPLIDCTQPHVKDLYSQSPACLAANEKTSVPDGVPQFKMGMIVFWEGSVAEEGSKTRTLHAQQHTFLVTSIPTPQPQLLCLDLSYQEVHQTNFTQSPLLVVDVCLNITNCHHSQLNITITANTTAGRKEQSNTVLSTLPFMWLGMSRQEITLSDHSTVQIPLTAGFTRTGVYNLSQVTVETATGGKVLNQVLKAPCLMRIDEVNL